MKVRITVLTENDEPISSLGDNPEEKVRLSWQFIFDLLSIESDKNEKAIVEKVEVFE